VNQLFMGTDDRYGFPADGEGPVRRVRLRPFRIHPAAVSNVRFAGIDSAPRRADLIWRQFLAAWAQASCGRRCWRLGEPIRGTVGRRCSS
jgi:formylglycine-generating enzyme required for sulfatase activity